MEPNGKFTETEVFAAQSQVWKYTYGFVDSLALRCAVELRIPDIIHSNGGEITLSQLASSLPLPHVDNSKLFRVMRFLVHMNIFQQNHTTSSYSLTPASHLLLASSEKSMVPSILGITHRDFMIPFHFIKEGLGWEGTAFDKGMGMKFWEYMERNPVMSQIFNDGMAAETRLLTSSLIARCKDMFVEIDSIVDVGGGDGTAMKGISEAFPHIKCTVFDLPHVIASSVECKGVERVSGDLFKAIPSAQAIMLKVS